MTRSGFGENSRAFKWMVQRIEGTAPAQYTAVGLVPIADQLDLDGLDVEPADVQAALRVDPEQWRAELPLIADWFDMIGDRLPSSMRDELESLTLRLGRASGRGPRPAQSTRTGHVIGAGNPMIRDSGIRERAGSEVGRRRVVSYWCVRGHHTSREWSATAAVPELWECRHCGLPAGQDRARPPEPAALKPSVTTSKTPLGYLLERRSQAECEALLAERLQYLRARRCGGARRGSTRGAPA